MITESQIHNIIEKALPNFDISQIRPHIRLREYGIDSLDFFAIILGLQDALGKEIPDEDISQLTTVESIQEYFIKNS